VRRGCQGCLALNGPDFKFWHVYGGCGMRPNARFGGDAEAHGVREEEDAD